jgi:hypothetical protein
MNPGVVATSPRSRWVNADTIDQQVRFFVAHPPGAQEVAGR